MNKFLVDTNVLIRLLVKDDDKCEMNNIELIEAKQEFSELLRGFFFLMNLYL